MGMIKTKVQDTIIPYIKTISLPKAPCIIIRRVQGMAMAAPLSIISPNVQDLIKARVTGKTHGITNRDNKQEGKSKPFPENTSMCTTAHACRVKLWREACSNPLLGSAGSVFSFLSPPELWPSSPGRGEEGWGASLCPGLDQPLI